MRADIIGHFKPCMTDIYIRIDARMADYIRTHPYAMITHSMHPQRTFCADIVPAACVVPVAVGASGGSASTADSAGVVCCA